MKAYSHSYLHIIHKYKYTLTFYSAFLSKQQFNDIYTNTRYIIIKTHIIDVIQAWVIAETSRGQSQCKDRARGARAPLYGQARLSALQSGTK
jgi:hypothetical protein